MTQTSRPPLPSTSLPPDIYNDEAPPVFVMLEGAKFALGQVCITPAAAKLLNDKGIHAGALLARHVRGDWGNIHPDDAALNVAALTDGSRIMSVYHLVTLDVLTMTPYKERHALPTIWIITDASSDDEAPFSRDVSTILIPEDY